MWQNGHLQAIIISRKHDANDMKKKKVNIAGDKTPITGNRTTGRPQKDKKTVRISDRGKKQAVMLFYEEEEEEQEKI